LSLFPCLSRRVTPGSRVGLGIPRIFPSPPPVWAKRPCQHNARQRTSGPVAWPPRMRSRKAYSESLAPRSIESCPSIRRIGSRWKSASRGRRRHVARTPVYRLEVTQSSNSTVLTIPRSLAPRQLVTSLLREKPNRFEYAFAGRLALADQERAAGIASPSCDVNVLNCSNSQGL